MKFIVITQDEEMAAAAKARNAFPPDDEVIVEGDWEKALGLCDGADLVFVDMVATLDEPHKVAGYERFAYAKMADPRAQGVPLVLIAPPDGYEMDFIAGWPDFVFAYLPRPVTEKIFRRASTWV